MFSIISPLSLCMLKGCEGAWGGGKKNFSREGPLSVPLLCRQLREGRNISIGPVPTYKKTPPSLPSQSRLRKGRNSMLYIVIQFFSGAKECKAANSYSSHCYCTYRNIFTFKIIIERCCYDAVNFWTCEYC